MDRHMVVFSDLDGTLLDHDTYSFEAAREALGVLAARGIPLVLATSKTAAEIAPLQRALRIKHPAIVENGAGVVIPVRYFSAVAPDRAGTPYAEIRRRLDALDPALRRHFCGFGDWTDAEVAERTGLSLQAAALARRRDWSEPGIWDGSAEDLERFRAAIAPLQAVQGGRFLTLMGETSKAERMRELVDLYRAEHGSAVRSLALGDAPNDIAMLEAADIGIIVANPAHAPLPHMAGEDTGRIRRTTAPGPAGWNHAVLAVIDEVDHQPCR